MQEHKKHLKTVFERFKPAGFTLHSSKCNIGVHQVKYLGHVFSEQNYLVKYYKWQNYCNQIFDCTTPCGEIKI